MTGSIRKPLRERFWAKVDVRGPDECWEWQGHRTKKGAGQIGLGTRKDGLSYTHVLSWKIHNGEIPKGLLVCHECDNPPCVNPKHLFLGTPAQNSADMKNKGRATFGERQPNSKLKTMQVIQIKELVNGGAALQEIADEFGVSRSLVGMISKGKRWGHLPKIAVGGIPKNSHLIDWIA